MTKHDPYSRRVLKQLFANWAGRHARLLAAMILVMLAIAAVETVALLLLPPTAWRAYALGATHVALIAATAHLIYSLFLTHERQAILHVRGAWGEENTREELKSARRRRLIWGWVDSIDLARGDIDHLVVTRQGGLVAIDSKWRSSDTVDREAMITSAKKVQLRAGGIANTYLKPAKGSHRANGRSFGVRCAVVLWGSAQHDLPDDTEFDGISFVGGRRLCAWLASLEGDHIDKGAANDLLRDLKRLRATSSNAAVTANR